MLSFSLAALIIICSGLTTPAFKGQEPGLFERDVIIGAVPFFSTP